MSETIFEQAEEAIHGRTDQHGGEDNFNTIAEFWTTYLGVEVTPAMVADLMILMKIARCKDGSYTEDNYVDISGYAYHGNRISQTERADGDADSEEREHTVNGEKIRGTTIPA